MAHQPRSTHSRQAVIQPPSRLEWNDEKLARLDVEQLKNLRANLAMQRAIGRISEQAALDLSQRIAARLPASAQTERRVRPRAVIQRDARAAEELGRFAAELGQQYDLSDGTARERSKDILGFKPEAPTDKRGLAKAGMSMKKGSMAIDRSISYRVRDSLVSLAFLLRPDEPHDAGRYVLLATDDLLESGVPITDVMPASRDYGWSRDSRGRMRAQPVQNFAEARALYEALIGRVAAKRLQGE